MILATSSSFSLLRTSLRKLISKVTNNAFNLDPAEKWPATACFVIVVFCLFVCFFVFFPRVDHLPVSLCSYKWLKTTGN